MLEELCNWIQHCCARHASAITEQKKCWELLAKKFDQFETLRNNSLQHATTCNRVCKRMQQVTPNNDGRCWPTVMGLFARGFSQDRGQWFTVIWIQSRFDWSLFTRKLYVKWSKFHHLSSYRKDLNRNNFVSKRPVFRKKIRFLGLKPKKVNKLTDRNNEPPNYKVTSL